jgi:hypothetical protein
MGKFIRPTLETKFHIDFSWWQQEGNNLRNFLEGHLCADYAALAAENRGKTFDWVDSETGEVFQIDMLWYIIYHHCQDHPEFFDSRTPLTTAIFRAFIARNNRPLTAVEIHHLIQRKSPDMILRTIGGRRTYKGIKAISE